ncbi:polyphosphate polymerase domain-containing protein [Phycicoccus endophyticus]|uniref:Polyphosphate polymerase domain-containing protein n=1 Tax=Phycicoccus endophyticus TaxID=1690220 RepID=A0A7G9R2I3_9MICO|nr:polyphosphate polymerase domain-containing protein [Phycicoccus endophyticus]NHI20734.1 polyphosphate polymerase domain-containing protein [Phycicoccus endophyticus]QNN49808.1 polyphosphate polymerase domain-containing protein [Phycicoccus endophyticus]GGL35296.1 VTC domain-containing protein [Phycicoccus endophyticus]
MRTLSPSALAALPPIGLEELVASSELLTRVDRKYALDRSAAELLLDLAPTGTRVLTIDDRRGFGYTTTYLDTPDLLTYQLAARRRRRRFKVRTRRYDTSGTGYLEVKTRDGSRTVKTRLDGDHLLEGRLDAEGAGFVRGALTAAGVSDRYVTELRPTLDIHYHRSTLQLADEGSRVTLDTGLRWEAADGTVLERPDLVVVETKSTGRACSVDRLLWSLGHRPGRISKYATGLAALDAALPANRWTRTLRDHF